MYLDTKEKMHETCNQVIDEIANLETGSEEHSRAVKDAVLMYNAQVEQWQKSEDQQDKHEKLSEDIEIEKEKIQIEKDKLKAEARIEAEKLEAEERKRRSELLGKVVVGAALIGSTALSLKEQKEGYLVPREVTRLGGDLMKFFKV